ncbi:MAG: GNAT family N-acetyltransferase [Planctomycetota bacterium]
MEIVHGVPERFRDRAVELYDEAFGAKFSVAIGSRVTRLALLRDSLRLDYSFAAVDGDQLFGLAGYQTLDGSFTSGMTFDGMIKRCGLLRGVWAALILSLYERSIAEGELLMDGIVVCSSVRGRGIGGKLLQRIADFATEQHYKSIRLDVIDTNVAAKRLYERNHFVATRHEEFGYLRWLLGFGASTTLVRSVE